jgi:hypothetical protein
MRRGTAEFSRRYGEKGPKSCTCTTVPILFAHLFYTTKVGTTTGGDKNQQAWDLSATSRRSISLGARVCEGDLQGWVFYDPWDQWRHPHAQCAEADRTDWGGVTKRQGTSCP